MNRLKDALDEPMLTPAQKDVRETIIEYREDGEPFINLHGPRNAGKTFLSWILREEQGWGYYQAYPKDPSTPTVIYDHGGSDREATRKLRNQAAIHGLATVVYVTEKPAREIFPRVELRPDDRHYETVSDTWDSLGIKYNKQNTTTNQ
jgi:hypothetical protein